VNRTTPAQQQSGKAEPPHRAPRPTRPGRKAPANQRQQANRAELDATLDKILATRGAARLIRQRAHWSAEDIADVVGVDPGAVFAWEAGLKRPEGLNARIYTRLLQVLYALEQPQGAR
jgi:DNA-binding transcriptional regulator YiaG